VTVRVSETVAVDARVHVRVGFLSPCDPWAALLPRHWSVHVYVVPDAGPNAGKWLWAGTAEPFDEGEP
jgi:hypothetical protein